MNRVSNMTLAFMSLAMTCVYAENTHSGPLWPRIDISHAIATKAKSCEGKPYRAGVSKQCANWVGEVVDSVGIECPSGHSLARNWLKWGKPVSYATMRPGDIIVQWRGSKSGTAGHILIYVGNGQCIHRSTYSKAVSRVSAESCKARILGIRRAKST